MVLLALIMAGRVHAYGALTVCLRVWISNSVSWNSASATIGNPGLRNGTWNIFAEVNSPDSDSGAFGSNIILKSVFDGGDYWDSGVANAYIGGYDRDGNYQSDSDSDSN